MLFPFFPFTLINIIIYIINIAIGNASTHGNANK